MKSILIVIYAHYVKLIIEGKKTVEVRKNKNLANAIKKLIAEQGGCWIYIYVAKGKPYLYNLNHNNEFYLDNLLNVKNQKLNGKVVARFWCDKVEEIKTKILPCNDPHKPATFVYTTKTLNKNELLSRSCLNLLKLNRYLFHIGDDWSASKVCGYAIHISKLEVFNKPKELNEFYRTIRDSEQEDKVIMCGQFGGVRVKKLTKAPKNYCYIESEK